jgi:DNA-binding NarL/FixJ family response regulator
LVTLLWSRPGFVVVPAAARAEVPLAVARKAQPAVVLMDLDMPGGGMTATARLAEEAPHVAVLVLTMSSDDAAVLAALQAGARGYLVKGASRAEVERALHTVAEGGVVVGSAVAHRLTALLHPPSAEPGDEFGELTTREREVLDLMAEGLDNGQIAERLFLSPKTVRNLVSSIFGKLRTSDRVQVVLRARQAGLGGGS